MSEEHGQYRITREDNYKRLKKGSYGTQGLRKRGKKAIAQESLRQELRRKARTGQTKKPEPMKPIETIKGEREFVWRKRETGNVAFAKKSSLEN